ncbi:hypothetical protein BH09PLA1_BH09PLA1_30660 [soil metagenome]
MMGGTMSGTVAQAWLQKVSELARQDPRKAGALGVLVLVLAIMLVRTLVAGDTQPSRAAGMAVGANSTSLNARGAGGATGAIGSSVNGVNSGNSLPAIDLNLAAIFRADSAARRFRGWMGAPIGPVNRNLFAVKLDYFPSDGSRPAQGVRTPADGEFWGRLEKSLMVQADQRDKRENLLANYKDQAAKLRLDSIIWGAQPKAMIEGKLVAEGDVVASFRVLKIEQRRIIVEREGIRLEIQMK